LERGHQVDAEDKKSRCVERVVGRKAESWENVRIVKLNMRFEPTKKFF
jgi:hypothetical protein